MQLDSTKDNSALEMFAKAVQAENLRDYILGASQGTAAALPEGVKLANIEPFMPERARFRGAMKTAMIEDFIEFVTVTIETADINADTFPCFVDPESMAARAYFNLGNQQYPGHGDHVALLKLKRTSTFEEVLKINGDKLEQRLLAEWMEDWVDVLAATNEHGEPMPMSAAVAAIRRITIGANAETTSEETSFSSKRSAMAEVEAKNRDHLPAFLQFTCEPYQGLSERTFTLRLNVITGENPRIGVRIVRLETAEEEMAKELEELLRKGFEDTAVRTFVGTFQP
ncbi:DUF2303 family protein [uncultured Marinobacter sp.]|uniref:DUF2303 family protein n=1 Tax=uncultured Marinobacter sp. TaxID=187379 RepID=UPI0030D76AD3|tara:strand:+ start:1970 stop:2821 length:852 start_codon:yes stop_codon:yes gene_type:complete